MTSLRLLVLDAYDAAGRRALARVGATASGELYRRMLLRHAPDARIDVASASDARLELPAGVGLADYHGMAWTGSNLSLAEPERAPLRRQVELARAASRAGVARFGSCFAAQLAAVASGGRCAVHPRGREFGIARAIELTAEGRRHPLFRGRPTRFQAFTSHADQVSELPPGLTPLAANDWCAVQALAAEGSAPFWAVQYHPEYDLCEIARLGLLRAEELVAQGRFPSLAALRAWAEAMQALQADPSQEALREELGLEAALLDPAQREIEVRNWIESVVRPRAAGMRLGTGRRGGPQPS